MNDMRAFMQSFKKGMIILWYGSIATIPKGWALCNGDNGTPDLRNRFVIAAGDGYDPDDTGGSMNHTHTFTTDGHGHALVASGAEWRIAGPERLDTAAATDTGTTGNPNTVPPYYALCYIMKL